MQTIVTQAADIDEIQLIHTEATEVSVFCVALTSNRHLHLNAFIK